MFSAPGECGLAVGCEPDGIGQTQPLDALVALLAVIAARRLVNSSVAAHATTSSARGSVSALIVTGVAAQIGVPPQNA